MVESKHVGSKFEYALLLLFGFVWFPVPSAQFDGRRRTTQVVTTFSRQMRYASFGTASVLLLGWLTLVNHLFDFVPPELDFLVASEVDFDSIVSMLKTWLVAFIGMGTTLRIHRKLLRIAEQDHQQAQGGCVEAVLKGRRWLQPHHVLELAGGPRRRSLTTSHDSLNRPLGQLRPRDVTEVGITSNRDFDEELLELTYLTNIRSTARLGLCDQKQHRATALIVEKRGVVMMGEFVRREALLFKSLRGLADIDRNKAAVLNAEDIASTTFRELGPGLPELAESSPIDHAARWTDVKWDVERSFDDVVRHFESIPNHRAWR